MRPHSVIYALLLAALMNGCAKSSDTPVPRRTAYPRIQEYDSTYVAADDVPVALKVNASSPVTTSYRQDGSVWVNAVYPLYGATLYCTLTPVTASTAESVIANRQERISLNLGSVSPQIETFTNSAGYFSTLITATSVPTTPIQFLSVNTEKPEWVVSGMVFFDGATATASTDSIVPIIRILERDVTVMLKELGS